MIGFPRWQSRAEYARSKSTSSAYVVHTLEYGGSFPPRSEILAVFSSRTDAEMLILSLIEDLGYTVPGMEEIYQYRHNGEAPRGFVTQQLITNESGEYIGGYYEAKSGDYTFRFTSQQEPVMCS